MYFALNNRITFFVFVFRSNDNHHEYQLEKHIFGLIDIVDIVGLKLLKEISKRILEFFAIGKFQTAKCHQ